MHRKTRPQKKIGIGELHGYGHCLRSGVELVAPCDEMTGRRIYIAGRKQQGELELLSGYLWRSQYIPSRDVDIVRDLTDNLNRVKLKDCGEPALVAGLLSDVRALIDQRLADDP